ncbi:MAG: hypothetical protein JSS59_10795 [Proteobacteria bacterium]|uniref:hypothetical protein n=1 Tax=Rudaea sp. TaxID=2136325 RepID=UPI0037843C55|nr:hypothetical protein [Pseudomonadota bacterium]
MKIPASPHKQHGVILFIALIALVVIMIAAVALIRSTDTAQVIAGNLAIKRDMTHESELAVKDALTSFSSGVFVTEDARLYTNSGSNYYATALSSNPQGIPYVLLQASTSGEAAAYATGMTYRYVIDRMCPQEGPPRDCQTDQGSHGGSFTNDVDVSANSGKGLGVRDLGVYYRVSVRVTDTRGAQSYFQTTFTSLGSP